MWEGFPGNNSHQILDKEEELSSSVEKEMTVARVMSSAGTYLSQTWVQILPSAKALGYPEGHHLATALVPRAHGRAGPGQV